MGKFGGQSTNYGEGDRIRRDIVNNNQIAGEGEREQAAAMAQWEATKAEKAKR
jgi:hypothetical protein